jgi:hypothetical protein
MDAFNKKQVGLRFGGHSRRLRRLAECWYGRSWAILRTWTGRCFFNRQERQGGEFYRVKITIRSRGTCRPARVRTRFWLLTRCRRARRAGRIFFHEKTNNKYGRISIAQPSRKPSRRKSRFLHIFNTGGLMFSVKIAEGEKTRKRCLNIKNCLKRCFARGLNRRGSLRRKKRGPSHSAQGRRGHIGKTPPACWWPEAAAERKTRGR